jgi:IstB-like ATP binding protein
MRHNPAAGAIIIMLRSLKMHGMAQAVGELAEQGSPAFEAALPILSQLLKAETADREVRSTAYQLKAARFPNYRDLAGFDFSSSEVNEALARQLHRCDFLEDAHNVVLVGGPGTGKTHLATAVGVQAIERHRKRVRFFSTVELVNALEQEKLRESQDRSPDASLTPTSSSSTNSATSRSALPAGLALPSAEQALRARQRHHYDQSQLWRVGHRVRRPEDDNGAPRSPHSPLPHSRNRKRQLPLQEQLRQCRQTHQGEISELDERLTLKPSSSRVSSQWKSRVKSRRKSTARLRTLNAGLPSISSRLLT